MRALLVVLDLPRRDLSLRVEQVLKPAHRQTLIPQPSVKALHSRILRRLARLYVHQLDLSFHAPRQKMSARQLWPVVAANCFPVRAPGPDPPPLLLPLATG